MFADYSLSIGDRKRILNLLNAGKEGPVHKYVTQMKDTDVIFIKLNVDKFPGPYHISIRTPEYIKEMEMNYNKERDTKSSQNVIDLFEGIYTRKTEDSLIVHIHYVTGGEFVQTSTFSLVKGFFEDENSVIPITEKETFYYTEELLRKMATSLIKINLDTFKDLHKELTNDNIIVISSTPFGEIESGLNLKSNIMKFLQKRMIDQDLSNFVLFYFVEDGYRFHGIGLTEQEFQLIK